LSPAVKCEASRVYWYPHASRITFHYSVRRARRDPTKSDLILEHYLLESCEPFSIELAEDAAQEAFINAYCDLPALRNPAAFPGWFRRIVFKHIDRIRRSTRDSNVPLDQVSEMASHGPGPAEVQKSGRCKTECSMRLKPCLNTNGQQ
jgi:DNA-directed RNA polymerase specialized sigma24 family protein